MGNRLKLHEILVEVLGSNSVYFQPPSDIRMDYPCICYKKSGENREFADNRSYLKDNQYTVTVIDPDPDSLIPDKVGELSMCRFVQFYTADDLNHFVYELYY